MYAIRSYYALLELVEVGDVTLQEVVVGQPLVEDQLAQGAGHRHLAPGTIDDRGVGVTGELDLAQSRNNFV